MQKIFEHFYKRLQNIIPFRSFLHRVLKVRVLNTRKTPRRHTNFLFRLIEPDRFTAAIHPDEVPSRMIDFCFIETYHKNFGSDRFMQNDPQ